MEYSQDDGIESGDGRERVTWKGVWCNDVQRKSMNKFLFSFF